MEQTGGATRRGPKACASGTLYRGYWFVPATKGNGGGRPIAPPAPPPNLQANKVPHNGAGRDNLGDKTQPPSWGSSPFHLVLLYRMVGGWFGFFGQRCCEQGRRGGSTFFFAGGRKILVP